MKRFILIAGLIIALGIGWLSYTCYSLQAECNKWEQGNNSWRDSFITLQVAVIDICDLETEHLVFAEFYSQQPKVYRDLGYIVP